jgi:integrase
MAKTPARDKFKNASHNEQYLDDTQIFKEILSTDMGLEPDCDTELSHKAIVNDSAVQHFFYKLSDNTQRVYAQAIEQYCLFCCKTPKQLLNEALNDENKIPNMRAHIQNLNSFCKFIESEGHIQEMPDGTIIHKDYAPKTILGKVTPIKSFYEKFGVEIPKKVVNINTSPEPLDNETIDKDTIKLALDNGEVTSLTKCIILGQTASGLLPVDILKLTIGQYQEGKTTIQKVIADKDGNEKLVDETLCKLVLERQKNIKRGGKPFVTFFSPEACSKIDAYLLQRNTSPVLDGENIDIESYLELPQEKRNKPKYNQYIAYMKQRYDIDIENGTSPDDLLLFVNQTIDHDFLKYRNDEDRKISSAAIGKMYYEASKKIGKLAPKYQRNELTAQNMRKFFGNILDNNTLKAKFVRHMMGHKSGAVEDAYYTPHQDNLQTFYVNECLPLIQFTETESMRLIDKDFLRLKTIEAENIEIKMQMEIQRVEMKYVYQVDKAKSEIQELEDRIELMGDNYEEQRYDGLETWVVTKENYIKDLKSATNIYNQIVALRDSEIEAVVEKYQMDEAA